MQIVLSIWTRVVFRRKNPGCLNVTRITQTTFHCTYTAFTHTFPHKINTFSYLKLSILLAISSRFQMHLINCKIYYKLQKLPILQYFLVAMTVFGLVSHHAQVLMMKASPGSLSKIRPKNQGLAEKIPTIVISTALR